jgi:hypothetical protein
MIKAFGVPRFNGAGKTYTAPAMVEAVNVQLERLGLTGKDIVSIQIDEEFYHVFYAVPVKPTE